MPCKRVFQINLILLIISTSALAQNPFPQGVEFYHWGEDGQVHSIVGSAMGISNDTTFYSFTPYSRDTSIYDCEVSAGCYVNDVQSSLGLSCYSIDDDDFTFINQAGESFRFLFDESANGPTTIYEDENTSYTLIYAGFETTSFLGQEDVVNLYSIVEFDNIDQVVTEEYEWIIRIGEVSGIHQMVDARTFLTEIEPFTVAGAEQFPEGFKPMLWSDAYDFQPGDVCQIKTEPGEEPPYYRKDSVLQRIDEPNEIQLLVFSTHVSSEVDWSGEEPSLIWTTWSSEDWHSYSHDLIVHEVPGYNLGGIRGENIWEDYNGQDRWSLHRYEISTYVECAPNIFCAETSAYSTHHARYVPGLGRVSSSGQSVGGSYNTELVYYKKGGEVWGEEFLVHVESEAMHALEFYPNPASNEISIVLPSTANYQLRILGTNGQVVESISISGKSSILLNISHLSSGIYLIEVQDDHDVFHQKLIVE